nr:EOG090X06KU [Moina brachiata]
MSQRSSISLGVALQVAFSLFWLSALCIEAGSQPPANSKSQLPDGYFPFEESPSRTPPKVRRPPYAQADVDCPGLDAPSSASAENALQSLDNLCGDLNKGYIPKSPMGRKVNGQAYPFELIRNKTLDFFSSTLPILKADKNLPKVAKYEDFDLVDSQNRKTKSKRDASGEEEEIVEDVESARRQSRGLCDKNYGILCTIINLLNNRFLSPANAQERVEASDLPNGSKHGNQQIGDDPLTPCPSAAEYVTPVYAKNYQGVWRYVVQIPYEGYFTQTVEVTKCLKKKCHFMDGSCLASPRWVSLLVAELFYPHARFPATKPGVSYRSMSNEKSFYPTPPTAARAVLPDAPFIPRSFPPESMHTEDEDESGDSESRKKRQTGFETSTSKPTYCDGVDEIGCFQVRLYYDWLLVPGSCKCWRQDFFTKYGRK